MIGKSIVGAFALGLLMALPAHADTAYPNIVERAEREGTFKTLLNAVRAAGLEDQLKGEKMWTVLAPTDEAFSSLPDGTMERLMKPENKEELTTILKGHILPGKVYASEWANERVAVKTETGNEVNVDGTGNSFTVNDANIIRLNVSAGNGLIHVIDQVLMAPSS
jgi:uncharacterized surface protein with fasciclin (FAS1) repeats